VRRSSRVRAVVATGVAQPRRPSAEGVPFEGMRERRAPAARLPAAPAAARARPRQSRTSSRSAPVFVAHTSLDLVRAGTRWLQLEVQRRGRRPGRARREQLRARLAAGRATAADLRGSENSAHSSAGRSARHSTWQTRDWQIDSAGARALDRAWDEPPVGHASQRPKTQPWRQGQDAAGRCGYGVIARSWFTAETPWSHDLQIEVIVGDMQGVQHAAS